MLKLYLHITMRCLLLSEVGTQFFLLIFTYCWWCFGVSITFTVMTGTVILVVVVVVVVAVPTKYDKHTKHNYLNALKVGKIGSIWFYFISMCVFSPSDLMRSNSVWMKVYGILNTPNKYPFIHRQNMDSGMTLVKTNMHCTGECVFFRVAYPVPRFLFI